LATVWIAYSAFGLLEVFTIDAPRTVSASVQTLVQPTTS